VIALDLLEGISGRVLKATRTSDHGEFDFGGIAPGLYFLRFREYPGGGGLIAISVDPNATTDTLDIAFGFSSCGLAYSDHSKCSQTELVTRELRGKVVDPMGAVIGRAEIMLSNGSENLIRIRTNDEGRFESFPAAGDYELGVMMPGFDPLKRKLRIDPAAKDSVLNVKLQVFFSGSCSSATVE
jgi:hypothetical protein